MIVNCTVVRPGDVVKRVHWKDELFVVISTCDDGECVAMTFLNARTGFHHLLAHPKASFELVLPSD